MAAQDAIGSSLAHPATRNSTPRHPTDLMCHHLAPGDPRAPIPGHIPTGNSPISPTSSLSTSMRVRDTPAISSAVMKDPTKARAMRIPRLSAGSGSEAGEFQSGQSQGMGSQAPPCTHPGSAQQLQPQFPAPGRTIHPGCSPRAPRRILQDGRQDETGIWGIWGSTEGLGGSPGVRDTWEALDGSVMCSSIVSTALSAGSTWRGRGAGEEQRGEVWEQGGSGNGEEAAEFPPHLHPAHSSLAMDPYGDGAMSHPNPGDASPGGTGTFRPSRDPRGM